MDLRLVWDARDDNVSLVEDKAQDALLRLAGSTSPENLGSSLKVLRQRHGLTLAQVAGRAVISKGHLCRLEKGEKSPSIRTLVRVLAVFGMSVSIRFKEQ